MKYLPAFLIGASLALLVRALVTGTFFYNKGRIKAEDSSWVYIPRDTTVSKWHFLGDFEASDSAIHEMYFSLGIPTSCESEMPKGWGLKYYPAPDRFCIYKRTQKGRAFLSKGFSAELDLSGWNDPQVFYDSCSAKEALLKFIPIEERRDLLMKKYP